MPIVLLDSDSEAAKAFVDIVNKITKKCNGE